MNIIDLFILICLYYAMPALILVSGLIAITMVMIISTFKIK